MAKFGRFNLRGKKAIEIYVGDYMEMDKGFVRIYNGSPLSKLNQTAPPTLVAAICLNKGQSMREISE